MIRLTEEEMRKMNKTSVRLRDGSGYVGYIEAIHMLHCVVCLGPDHCIARLRLHRSQKRIYQAQYPEHYPKLQQDKDAFSMHHWSTFSCPWNLAASLHRCSGILILTDLTCSTDHCLEVLRQGIMCNADVSINTYFWENPRTIKGSRAKTRKCTDWSRLQAWADERTLSASDRDAFLETLVPMGQREVSVR